MINTVSGGRRLVDSPAGQGVFLSIIPLGNLPSHMPAVLHVSKHNVNITRPAKPQFLELYS
jgi:hypothetical protein